MKWCFIDTYEEQYVAGYDLSQLKLDQFYMKINSTLKEVFLYTLNTECYKCPYVSKHFNNSTFYKTNTKFRVAHDYQQYYPQDHKENVICDIDDIFGQFGVYSLNINDSGCSVTTIKEPVNTLSPILTVALIYLLLFIIMTQLRMLWNRFAKDKWDSYFQNKSEKEQKKSVKSRVKSLDIFRGIVIVIMIFANLGNGGFQWFGHARWNGLHVADLVFPSFMWIMGACVPISLLSSFKKGISNRILVRNVISRSIKLFCLGIFLTSGTDLGYLRIFGVLQRFGIAYLFVTIICIFTMERSMEVIGHSWRKHIQDMRNLLKGWIIVILILLVHTLIIFFVTAPGCPRGYLGPGGLHKNRSYLGCVGGATGYIDRLILGEHAYQHPTIYEVYEARPFDPEGIVGCLTTIFQVYLGVQAGMILLVYKEHTQRLLRWLLWAIGTGVLGAILAGFSKENGIIPVNKNLWSLSFVLVTSSFAFFLLSVCYVLVDMKRWWSGKPFLFAGMNAILMYIGHEMTGDKFPVRWYPHDAEGDPRRTHFIAIMSDSWGTFIWILISYYLYKINYFFAL